MDYLKVNCDSEQYKIFIGYGILRQINELLEDVYSDSRIFIVMDQNVSKLYLNEILEILSGREVDYAIVGNGESSKSIDSMKYIYGKLLENNYGRDTLILSVGGGSVGDLAGFVSATYMRGIPYIQIPTTIVSQVNSCIGGKVGINFKEYKNISGAYYHPKSVILDLDFIKTLNYREYLSGLSEIIKYGIIEDYSFLKDLKENIQKLKNKDKKYLYEIIEKSLKIKRMIVEIDEKDYGIRRILNFGNTIGDSISSISPTKEYTYGERTALGMIYETILSYKMGLISEEYCKEIISIFSFIIKPIKYELDEIELFYEDLEKDKKQIGENILFILPTEEGRVGIFKNVEKQLITNILKNGIESL